MRLRAEQNPGGGITANMEPNKSSILILALGNDFMGDDAVGLHAAKALRQKYDDRVTIVEAMIAGYSLLELLDGYTHVLLLDAISTGMCEPGTIREFSMDEFEILNSASPHYVGIPEVFALGTRLDLEMPSEFRILTMEIENPREIHEGLNPAIELALETFLSRADAILRAWC